MKSILFMALALTSMHASAAYKVRTLQIGDNTQILSVEKTSKNMKELKAFVAKSIPYLLSEGPEKFPTHYQEIFYADLSVPPMVKEFYNNSLRPLLGGSEMRILVNQGPKENRINLTILGDGYTVAEKEKFFSDAMNTTQKLFTGSTFASYLPLFNVYAVYVPSATHGIGNGRPLNTAFKLYRNPPNSKRAIMPGDTNAAETALRLAPATDYPIILANDEFYGGLGGRFAISTSSARSGMIVLRHELGHNFGEVGEEYDGGYVYTGANSSGSNLTWGHWVNGGKVNEAVPLAGDYVWQNLNGNPFKQSFNFPSTPGMLFAASISTVGWATPNDVGITMDNQIINLSGAFHNDRNFYDIGPIKNLSPGIHNFEFKENIQDGDNVLAFSRLYAYPQDYDFTPMRIGAYATYDDHNRKVGYRPTHDSCLMRNMMVPYFCSVDKENMWLKFLARVNLIDDVTVKDGSVTLNVPKLQGLEIHWFQIREGGQMELPQYQNILTWKIPPGMNGAFKVRVDFRTPEVRKYNQNFQGEKKFSI